eukprot:CAMPEP_0197515062 /NCGR_PEP_ID=MMETSP1318-20131121/303_1 /TAXON_ID=552666 /ORGANISM="Partenskyella glossopodia, Strain RCC365" /LENGTH=482 /DNA_ID=CAMNT_0043063321 /DNA_START=65 /DNA_END=1516 /DNA_ORIENTATION=-
MRGVVGVALASFLLVIHGVDATHDVSYSRMPQKLAFGSCNKPWKNQFLWEQIEAKEPDVFMWTGDAVYTNTSYIEDLWSALNIQLENTLYSHFLSQTRCLVVGAIDDHDYGVNDAGRNVPNRKERIQAYNMFLHRSNKNQAFEIDPKIDDTDLERDGLYSSHTFTQGDNQVSVIILDTRSSRDPYPLALPFWLTKRKIRFFGKFFGTINTILRVISASVSEIWNTKEGNTKDMLGEQQWQWLENHLKHSKADFHILISSVQMFTTNPFVESWGHFPASRHRLAQLLNTYNVTGSLVLSGDVHFAEHIGSEENIVEITSSGMTHHATNTYRAPFLSTAVKFVIHRFHKHRPYKNAFYNGINFGGISFDWNGRKECVSKGMLTQIYDEDGNTVLSSWTCSDRQIDWMRLHENTTFGVWTALLIVLFTGCCALLCTRLLLGSIFTASARNRASAGDSGSSRRAAAAVASDKNGSSRSSSSKRHHA